LHRGLKSRVASLRQECYLDTRAMHRRIAYAMPEFASRFDLKLASRIEEGFRRRRI
jgi:hypothetical protein